MPRISKIAPGQRRGWLERFEQGDSIDKIARDASRDVRTVREHVEKARLERDFESAQRDQLREALRAHQQDMLALLVHLRQAVRTPELTFMEETYLDYGLEDLWEPLDLAQHRQVGFGPAFSTPGGAQGNEPPRYGPGTESAPAIQVVRDASGPQEVLLAAEDSRLWRGLREHLGKDSLWRRVSDWKKALLEELKGRAQLNRAVRAKAEEVFGLPVNRGTVDQTTYLPTHLVWWVRARLTNLALGNPVGELERATRTTQGGGLETLEGRCLTVGHGDAAKPIQQIRDVMAALTGSAQVQAANYRDLQDQTRRIHDCLDELLLVHHIRGRCSICNKLSGQ